MLPKRSGSIPMRLDVLPFAAPAGDLTWIRCVNCRLALGLHQPDAQAPDRLLGICGVCSAWFLVELVIERSEVVMMQLPDGRSLPQKCP